MGGTITPKGAHASYVGKFLLSSFLLLVNILKKRYNHSTVV